MKSINTKKGQGRIQLINITIEYNYFLMFSNRNTSIEIYWSPT